MTRPADLNTYLFDAQAHPLSDELLQWMISSTRFTTFVKTYRDKIRKKIRTNPDPESVLDLRAELGVARGLLGSRRLELVYEPYASEKRRGPDFAVTYRANLVFNIEVARIRQAGSQDLQHIEDRIPLILLDKLGQMQPGMPNLLVIHTRADLARSIDLARIMQEVKTRAEGMALSHYTLGSYTTPAAFYKDFLHLSAILPWAPGAQAWINKQARPPLDEKVLRLVGSLPSSAPQT